MYFWTVKSGQANPAAFGFKARDGMIDTGSPYVQEFTRNCRITCYKRNQMMNKCEKCRDLDQILSIKFPSDLKKVIRIAKENVADNTLQVLEEQKWKTKFDQVTPESGWDDLVSYVFRCNTCGEKFELVAETYHGSGGHWKPLK